MSQFEFYNNGKDRLYDWGIGTYQFMLMKSGSFDATDVFVADISPGTNELTVPAYTRVAPSSPTRDISASPTEYTVGSNPDFGDLTVSPETAIAIVLFKEVTNDADSLLICWGSFSPTNTADLNPFVPLITGLLIAELA